MNTTNAEEAMLYIIIGLMLMGLTIGLVAIIETYAGERVYRLARERVIAALLDELPFLSDFECHMAWRESEAHRLVSGGVSFGVTRYLLTRPDPLEGINLDGWRFLHDLRRPQFAVA